jgi:hypothetical protein
MPNDYTVGYGKPPSRTQFQKGHSGNPTGRPKGTKNLKTDLVEELQERILVREAGGEKQLSKQRALLKSLTAKAIKGDTRAANIVLSMMLRILEDDPDSGAETPLSSEEWDILRTLEERLPGAPGADDGGDRRTVTGLTNGSQEP